MSWFRADDSFPEHPKLEALEETPRRYMAAITVWTVMGCDCARRLTDGYVSKARLKKVLRKLGKAAAEGAQALVDAGLWEPADDGWTFHDWHDYQPSKVEVEAARAAKTERQRRWRKGKADLSVDGVVDASTDRLGRRGVDASVDASPARVSPPIPSHPLPSQETHTERVCVREDPLAEGERGTAAASVQTRFRSLYLGRYQVEPGMGGQHVAGFPAQLEGTARARGVAPLALLETAFVAWAEQGRPGRERSSAYAAFVARFDSLVDPPEASGVRGGLPSTVPELRALGMQAVIAGDIERVKRINARVAEVERADERGQQRGRRA